MSVEKVAAGIVGIAGVAVLAWMYAVLPEVVASHFGPNGAPDAWMSRASLIGLLAAVQAIIFAVAPLGTTLVERLPTDLVNLPNKDYWLQPEHRAEAVERLGRHAWAFSAGVGLFVVLTEVLVARANLGRALLEEGPFLLGLGALFVFTIVWVVRLNAAFRVPLTRGS